DPSHCLGSDHLPIHYTLDFEVKISKSIKFNSDKMDLDAYLGILRDLLGVRPLPVISTPEELDNAVEFLNGVMLAAMEGSTPRHTPSSMAKRWWSPGLTRLRTAMRRSRRTYQRTRVPSARADWLAARRYLYGAIASAKREILAVYLKELERVNVYKALKRLKETIRDPETGDMIISHHERGRALGRAWFGDKAVEVADAALPLSPDVRPATRADQPGSGARTERGGVHSEALPLRGLPPSADRQDSLPASHITSEAPDALIDPIELAESIDIVNERAFVPVTDTEVDSVILSSSPWKSPDYVGIQMGHIQRGYSVTRDWIRPIFKASVKLGREEG
ncbi:hypothetical protein B0H14DRAFT_3760693, partial [Mycena olivaceomarginata]